MLTEETHAIRATDIVDAAARLVFLDPPAVPQPPGAGGGGVRGVGLLRPRRCAEELAQTPRQTEGPFYPDKLPLDTDNDLIIINDDLTPAVGEITHLTGRILDAKGDPVRNALVEIWQCDANGVYLHSRTGNRDKQRQELPGLRPVPHRLDRRVLLPHDQAGRLPRPHAAHPLQDQGEGRGRADDAVLHQGPPAERPRRRLPRHPRREAARNRCSPTSSRSRTRRSASWPRTSTSSSVSRPRRDRLLRRCDTAETRRRRKARGERLEPSSPRSSAVSHATPQLRLPPRTCEKDAHKKRKLPPWPGSFLFCFEA